MVKTSSNKSAKKGRDGRKKPQRLDDVAAKGRKRGCQENERVSSRNRTLVY